MNQLVCTLREQQTQDLPRISLTHLRCLGLTKEAQRRMILCSFCVLTKGALKCTTPLLPSRNTRMFGKHIVKLDQESVYNEIKRKWVDICITLGGSYIHAKPSTLVAKNAGASLPEKQE